MLKFDTTKKGFTLVISGIGLLQNGQVTATINCDYEDLTSKSAAFLNEQVIREAIRMFGRDKVNMLPGINYVPV